METKGTKTCQAIYLLAFILWLTRMANLTAGQFWPSQNSIQDQFLFLQIHLKTEDGVCHEYDMTLEVHRIKNGRAKNFVPISFHSCIMIVFIFSSLFAFFSNSRVFPPTPHFSPTFPISTLSSGINVPAMLAHTSPLDPGPVTRPTRHRPPGPVCPPNPHLAPPGPPPYPHTAPGPPVQPNPAWPNLNPGSQAGT